MVCFQSNTMADSTYMLKQNEVNWRMRGILIDWLIEVHGKFRLLPETIFLATNIVDRFLSIRVVSLVKFQLVGITALLLASKYEEIICPSIQSFLYMTDGGYTDDEMLRAERYILQMIGFDFSYPNPINFLRRISKADAYDIQSRTVAKYFMEMTCVERQFLAFPPSIIAGAAAWLARKMLDRGPWVGPLDPIYSVDLLTPRSCRTRTLFTIRHTRRRNSCLARKRCSTMLFV